MSSNKDTYSSYNTPTRPFSPTTKGMERSQKCDMSMTGSKVTCRVTLILQNSFNSWLISCFILSLLSATTYKLGPCCSNRFKCIVKICGHFSIQKCFFASCITYLGHRISDTHQPGNLHVTYPEHSDPFSSSVAERFSTTSPPLRAPAA